MLADVVADKEFPLAVGHIRDGDVVFH